MARVRVIAIWVSGLIATGLFGSGIAIQLGGGFDAPFFGFVAGIGAFTCFRLWFGEWANSRQHS